MEMLKLVQFVFCVTVVHARCDVKQSTCYVDDVNNRLLGKINFPPKRQLSLESCAQICHDQGMDMAGTEYGIYLTTGIECIEIYSEYTAGV